MSFFPPYCHSFRITVIPSGLLSFFPYYCHSFQINVILPNYCHFKYFPSEYLLQPPIPKGREKWPPEVAIYASCSKIQLNIEQILNLEYFETRVCVARWLYCLGQIPIVFEKFQLSWVQLPLQEPDFFFLCSNYFKFFMYTCITYNDKKKSKLLSNSLKITLNF